MEKPCQNMQLALHFFLRDWVLGGVVLTYVFFFYE